MGPNQEIPEKNELFSDMMQNKDKTYQRSTALCLMEAFTIIVKMQGNAKRPPEELYA